MHFYSLGKNIVVYQPPEATVAMSNEESDRMLSQMNDDEVEQYKQMMRSMQSMCETYKKEVEQLFF
jgi:hypothetical protein